MTNIRLPAVRCAVLAIGMISVSATQSIAQDSDMIAEGRELAQEWCSKCHNIEAGGPFKLHPPSFASIAVYRSAEQIYGRIITPPVHSSMPQVAYVLTTENLEVLSSYIQSLESDSQ